MRVPPPGTLRLRREELLRDVRERLDRYSSRLAAGAGDPTNPGWVVLEQAAWMVEILSEQLDRYPFAVIQHLVNLMGGELIPARPALGAVVVEAAVGGVMRRSDGEADRWRFYTAQTERSVGVEFVPLESPAVWRGRITSMIEVRDGEVLLNGRERPRAPTAGLYLPREGARRSSAFDGEEFRYTAAVPRAADWIGRFRAAVDRLQARNLGWLRLSLENGTQQVTVVARVDTAGAFARTAPGGLWSGGDLEGDWASLDDVAWTPTVVLSPAAEVPAHTRGTTPLVLDAGRILIPGLRSGARTEGLLARRPAAAPWAVVDAVWRALARSDEQLSGLSPIVERRFPGVVAADEPGWLPGAVAGRRWQTLAGGAAATLIHLRLDEGDVRARSIRVAVLVDAAGLTPAITAYAVGADGVPEPEPAAARIAWILPGGTGSGRLIALDISLPEGSRGAVLRVDGPVEAALFNAVLVGNLPAVRDGREIRVRRNVPEPISLLFEDVVTTAVVDTLREQPLPASLDALLAGLELSRVRVDGGDEVVNWEGVSVDASAGLAVLNAADTSANVRPFRPGQRLKLDWYRRTDGAAGNVPAGSIKLVEEGVGEAPRLLRVRNPLPTSLGADREGTDDAVERLFAPGSDAPVLASDFERIVRGALGSQGHGWVVRCWSYSERALLSCRLWPFGGLVEDPEAAALAKTLDEAGPEQLLVVTGPTDRLLSQEELDHVRRQIRAAIQAAGRRLPVVRDAVVARLWPLTLTPEDGPEGSEQQASLPSFDLGRLRGTLADAAGHRARSPGMDLLLNGAVVAIARSDELRGQP